MLSRNTRRKLDDFQSILCQRSLCSSLTEVYYRILAKFLAVKRGSSSGLQEKFFCNCFSETVSL